jgi:hypothetical protein
MSPPLPYLRERFLQQHDSVDGKIGSRRGSRGSGRPQREFERK